MDMGRTYRIAASIIFLLLAGALFVGVTSHATQRADSTNSAAHGRIVINNNVQFKIIAENEGWPGNGTKDDPYIIEGYRIDAHGADSAVYIGNTTVYFILRNNIIYNVSTPSLNPNAIVLKPSAGIFLLNVKHGVIEDNTITGGDTGIYFLSSSENKIINNTCREDFYGIYLSFNSQNNTLRGNTCVAEFFGLTLSMSNHNIIVDNIFRGNNSGVVISSSTSNRFYSNTLEKGGFIFPHLVDEPATWSGQIIAENNTVNGKPVYYYKNMDAGNASVPKDAGQVIVVNSRNLRIENLDIEATTSIDIHSSKNIRIENCTLRYPENASQDMLLLALEGISRIWVWNSEEVIMKNNTVIGRFAGIYLAYQSSKCSIVNNTLRDGMVALYMDTSYTNTVQGNRFYNSSIILWGDKKTFTSQNISSDNTVNGKPVYYYKNRDMKNVEVPQDAGEIIAGNVINMRIRSMEFSNDSAGILVGYAYNITIENVSISNSVTGINLLYTNDSLITGNRIRNCSTIGIYLTYSSRNRIVENWLYGGEGPLTPLVTRAGVEISEGEKNRIERNSFENLDEGVMIYFGSRTVVKNNTFHDSKYGIYIEFSEYDEIHGNRMYGCGVVLLNIRPTDNITSDNTVNGKPVYYYSNGDMHDVNVPKDAGEIIAMNVTNLRIDGVDISNTSVGIIIGYSINVTVSNSTVHENIKGVFIDGGSNIVIENNLVSENRDGIVIQSSDNCIIRNNIIMGNTMYGVNLSFAFFTKVYGNQFYYNHDSGEVYSAAHVQARDDGFYNSWNTTDRGNYWHDWSGPDENGDGIVDLPYIIDGSAHSKDYRPMAEANIPELYGAIPFVIIALLAVLIWRRRAHSR